MYKTQENCQHCSIAIEYCAGTLSSASTIDTMRGWLLFESVAFSGGVPDCREMCDTIHIKDFIGFRLVQSTTCISVNLVVLAMYIIMDVYLPFFQPL